MGQVQAIRGKLRQINTSVEKPTPEQPETGRKRMNLRREEQIRSGQSNLGFGDILIFDFDGDPTYISKAENDRMDNVRIEVEYTQTRANGLEIVSYTKFTVGEENDDVTEKDGDAPFSGIRAEKDENTHLNLFHAFCTGGHHGKARFRQVRTVDIVEFISPWVGAGDGQGFRVGRQ